MKMLEKVTAAQNRRPPETCDVPERETNAFKKELASSLVAVKLVLEADSKSGFGGNELTEEGVGFTAAARVAAAMACQNFRRGTTVV